MGFARIDVGPCLEVHLAASVADDLGSGFDSTLGLFTHRRELVVRPDRYFEIAERRFIARREREPIARRLNLVGSRHDVHADFQIPRASAEGSDHREVGLRKYAGGGMAAGGQQAPGGFVSEHTAEVRRIANGATDVRTGLEARETRSECRRRTAGRATRDALEIPGIVRGPVDFVVGLKVGEMQRHVGLAEEHDARLFETLDRKGIHLRDVVLVRRIAACGG